MTYAERLERIDAAMRRAHDAETARLELADARYFRHGDALRVEGTGEVAVIHDTYPGSRIGVRWQEGRA